jgi:hypothetical protein
MNRRPQDSRGQEQDDSRQQRPGTGGYRATKARNKRLRATEARNRRLQGNRGHE